MAGKRRWRAAVVYERRERELINVLGFVFVCVRGTGDEGSMWVSWVGLNPARPPTIIYIFFCFSLFKIQIVNPHANVEHKT